MSNNGRCVLYVENTDGKVGQTYDEEGKPVAVMGKHFRMFASTLIDDLFTEPFVLCELNHPIDQITTFLTSGGMLSALATHIVSGEQSKAELHGIEVPLVACATPLGAIANSGAVVPGAASESFTVTVRNDGNTLLTAGTIDLYREGLKPAVLQRIHRIRRERTHGIDPRSGASPTTLRLTIWHA